MAANTHCARCGHTEQVVIVPVKFTALVNSIQCRQVRQVPICRRCIIRMQDPAYPLFNMRGLQALAAGLPISHNVTQRRREIRPIPAGAYR